MKTTLYAALGLVMAATVAATAQPTAAPSGAATMTSPAAGETSPASKAFKAADEKMMRGMMQPMTGDADRDFAAGMLPHHQGAVDMAKVELRYGKDPEMLALAKNIVATQQKEIAQMQAWQARHAAAH
ncbi:CopM family metallochaperone [Rhodopila sp.]|uniref:CopM family metallochaperone n=1 Tax=Rhodopila sp. TaxID=2480087 RepID=UPI003D11CC2A